MPGIVIPRPIVPDVPIKPREDSLQKLRKRMEAEARAFVERILRETGYLPKQYEMMRAADKEFDRAEREAHARAWQEAQQRIKEREAYQRDIFQYNLAMSWKAVWTAQAIRDSLGGTFKSLFSVGDSHKIGGRLNDAREKRIIAKHVVTLLTAQRNQVAHGLNTNDRLVKKALERVARASPSLSEAQEALEGAQRTEDAMLQQQREVQVQVEQHAEHVHGAIGRLIASLANPWVSAREASEIVRRFLHDFRVTNVNLIKKLSEIITAKALWFRASWVLFLLPGPKAEGGSDSPDYVGIGLVADNLRIEGIKRVRGELVLRPSPQQDERAIGDILNAIINGVSSKLATYKQNWLIRRGNRLVVTIDLSDNPWIMQPNYLFELRRRLKTKLGGDAQRVHAVYFVINGEATRIFPP